jgi:TatA/E family protein of Tat protein translocase
MFGIGMPEMILILAVALIVIGPKKLPDLAKSLGKAMGEFKKATSDLKESMQIDSELKDLKNTFDDLEKDDRKPVKKAARDAEPQSTKSEKSVEKIDDEENPGKTADPLEKVKGAFNRDNDNVKDVADMDGADPVKEVEPEEQEISDADSVAESKPEKSKDV